VPEKGNIMDRNSDIKVNIKSKSIKCAKKRNLKLTFTIFNELITGLNVLPSKSTTI
jgi:hypothetical protein